MAAAAANIGAVSRPCPRRPSSRNSCTASSRRTRPSGSTPSAGIVSYNAATGRWEVSGSHTYAVKGKYEVTTLVTDANGATGTAVGKMNA